MLLNFGKISVFSSKEVIIISMRGKVDLGRISTLRVKTDETPLIILFGVLTILPTCCPMPA